jgi:outer membrane protein assembly factor BamB
VWTSEQTEYPWGSWWPYSTATYPYNSTSAAIITGTYEGIYAINWADGKILWHYSTESTSVPFEGPYNAEPFFTGVSLADGKVYAYNGEHTATYPRTRSWSTYCVNATDGALLWKIHNPMTPGAIADGYLTAANVYDGKMYVFGKGLSATTVTAPDIAVPQGTGVVIKGTVLDQSPGQPGTPCVSKESMTLEMEHIHMAMPLTGLWGNETLTGVPVILTAIGADGSVTDLGTVTTNGYGGTFGYTWIAPKSGDYTIMASFAGDDSYGSSTAYTSVSIGPAPTTTAAPATSPPASQPYATSTEVITDLAVGVIVIIIAIAIVGALLLRRK